MTTLRTPPESKLGIDLQAFRTDRPDEWRMDEFTCEAEAMNEQNKALNAVINEIHAMVTDVQDGFDVAGGDAEILDVINDYWSKQNDNHI